MNMFFQLMRKLFTKFVENTENFYYICSCSALETHISLLGTITEIRMCNLLNL